MSADTRYRPGPGDFDFLIGTWHVHNRRLLAPLTGSDAWEEFPGTAVCHGTLFAGAANLDEITFTTKGFSGLTLRLYDPRSAEWSLNWSTSLSGRLSAPIVGRFDTDRRGEFHGEEAHEDAVVPCRFVWSGITADAARWEQAFSPDGGGTWETNWTMSLSRTG
ncbi:hypothetical protein [Streptomyces sp. Ac-502]|uniref:hypothetical protein n=1 Tax=Streptomyces sp. Ac-502 TaxID=3342801 RepID=UPI003862CDEF